MANSNAKGMRVFVTNDIPVTLDASDLQIGAVEIKNATTDDRVLVAAPAATPTFAMAVLPSVANAADPSLTEAKMAYRSTDLAGYARTILKAETTKVIGTVRIDQATPGTTNGVQLTGAQLTPASSTVTTDGTVAAGKYFVEFILSTDFSGTLNGIAYAGANDAYKSFPSQAGRALGAISYTVSAGSARLTTI